MSGFLSRLFSGSEDKKQTIKYVRNNVQKQGELVDHVKIQNEQALFNLKFVSPLESQNMQKKHELDASNKLFSAQNGIYGSSNSKYAKNIEQNKIQKSRRIFGLQQSQFMKKSFNDYYIKQSRCHDINLHSEQQQNYRHNRKERLFQRPIQHNRRYDQFPRNHSQQKQVGVSRYQKPKISQIKQQKDQVSTAKFPKAQNKIEQQNKQAKKNQMQKQPAENSNNREQSKEHRSSLKRQPIFLNRRRSLNKKINNQEFDVSRYKDGYNDGYKDALNKINSKGVNNSFYPPLINWNKSMDMHANHSGRTIGPSINVVPPYYNQNIRGYPQRVPAQPLYGQQGVMLPLHRVVYENRLDDSRITSNTKIQSNQNISMSQGENIQKKPIDFQYQPNQQIMPPGELAALIKKARQANYRKKVY